MIQAEADFYARHNANPLRGFYELGVDATQQLETARVSVRDFLHAADSAEIIFTRNTTESLNLVAYSYALTNLRPGDEVVVSIMEHHSNLLPWQDGHPAHRRDPPLSGMRPGRQSARWSAFQSRYHGQDPAGGRDPRFQCVGYETPVKAIVAAAHAVGAVVVLDAARPHRIPCGRSALDVDFLAFSGHKLLGPMGVGVLYGKRALLEAMPPFLTGGEMIDSVTRTGAGVRRAAP